MTKYNRMDRRYRIFFFILILLSGTPAGFAQTNDFGTWFSISAEKEIKDWTLSFEEELRTMDNSSEIQGLYTKLGLEYKLFKPVDVGFSYQYIHYKELDLDDFQPRHRLNFYTQGKQKLGRFKISLRERLQATFKDETERDYKMNPKWSWRNKLKLEYNIRQSPITPGISAETFYQLNNPDGNRFDQLRFAVEFEYKINKRNQIELYGMVKKEINVKDPLQRSVIGISYNYSF